MQQIKPGSDPLCPNGFRGGLHAVVWTVPYTSACNPIEFVWSIAKGHVAATNGAKTTMKSAKEALQNGLYGVLNVCGGVTPEFAGKCFANTERLAGQWAAQSAALSAVLPLTPEWQDCVPICELTAARRAAYGPVAAAHRQARQTRKPEAAGADDGDAGDDDGDDSAPESGDDDDAPVSAAVASASGSGAGGASGSS